MKLGGGGCVGEGWLAREGGGCGGAQLGGSRWSWGKLDAKLIEADGGEYKPEGA